MTTKPETYKENVPIDVDMAQDEWDELSYDMQYYYANKDRREYLKDKSKEIRERNREYVNNLKEESECKECGEEHPATLVFHHIGEKTGEISNLVKSEYSLDRIKDEIENCVIICANCHRKEHFGD